jgi:hypothetical protein
MYSTGFLKVDPDHQRGKDTVTGKDILDAKKIQHWSDQLLDRTAYLGTVSLNFRRERVNLMEQYDEARRLLTISSPAYIPDGRHRIEALVRAARTAGKGSTFDLGRKVSVRIYNVPEAEEDRIFYAMNQEGRKADATRSKWLHAERAGYLAQVLVQRMPTLTQENVDVYKDRMSRKNYRLCSFGTIAQAFERHWTGEIVTEDHIAFFLKFWAKLVEVRPELQKLTLAERQQVRETSLADAALAIHAYVGVGVLIYKQGADLALLDRLSDFDFSRTNPLWVAHGILTKKLNKEGKETLQLTNTAQSRDAAFKIVAARLGLIPPLPEAKVA